MKKLFYLSIIILFSFANCIAHLHPKRVIFIDDREDNLKNVEGALHKYNPHIQYDGIHYLGANHYPSPQISEQEFETKWSALAELTKTIN